MTLDSNQPLQSKETLERASIFTFDSKALARLAQATSSSIAWLLLLPDAVASLPGAEDPVAYFLTLLGLWVSAAVLWFVSFWGILNLLRLTCSELTVSSSGIKLWRFAKLIPWDDIQAIEIAPQLVFSKFFSLGDVARRLTLFESRKSGPKIIRGRLITHNIPSFLFSTADFDTLASAIIEHKFGLNCDTRNVFLFESQAVKQIKRINKVVGWQRIGVTALIAVGLITLLGRKSIVNYSYNYGNKCLAEGNLLEAKKRYQTALTFEPTFPAALNNLGITEFGTGDVDSARKHWQRAIAFKPDYVEARISLAHLCLKERKFKEASEYIENAINVAPMYSYGTLKRAEYNMQLGRNRFALTDARAVTTQNPSAQVAATAICLIAQAKLRMGDVDGAKKAIAQLSQIPNPINDVEFQSYRASVASELAVQSKDFSAAEKLARVALRLSVGNYAECVQPLVHVLVLQNKLDEAQKLASQAVKKSADSPFGYIAKIEVDMDQNQIDDAMLQLSIAEKLTSVDAYSSRLLASEALKLGRREQAIDLLARALKIDDSAGEAKKLKDLQLSSNL